MKVKVEMEVMSPDMKMETMTWIEDTEKNFEEFLCCTKDELDDKFLLIALEETRQLMVRTNDIMRVTISCLDIGGEKADGCVEIPAETAGTAE